MDKDANITRTKYKNIYIYNVLNLNSCDNRFNKKMNIHVKSVKKLHTEI